jgi:hypothetical protein
MVFKTLLKLSLLVLCLMLVSACGYMKDIKEKLPDKTRTEEPASTTIDGKANSVDESTEKDVNSDQSSNTQVPPKSSTNQ